MYPRRIKFKYDKIILPDLVKWLRGNNVKHRFIPDMPERNGLGNLIFLLEIYSARDETAIRIKWETE